MKYSYFRNPELVALNVMDEDYSTVDYIAITRQQAANLKQLAIGLYNMPPPDMRFTMASYDSQEADSGATCGSAGCAIGAASLIIEPRRQSSTSNFVSFEGWTDFAFRLFGLADTDEGKYLFGVDWSRTDNTALGAAQRITRLLRYGLDHDWQDQMLGRAGAQYKDEYEGLLP